MRVFRVLKLSASLLLGRCGTDRKLLRDEVRQLPVPVLEAGKAAIELGQVRVHALVPAFLVGAFELVADRVDLSLPLVQQHEPIEELRRWSLRLLDPRREQTLELSSAVRTLSFSARSSPSARRRSSASDNVTAFRKRFSSGTTSPTGHIG
jgi:hypothetical protein